MGNKKNTFFNYIGITCYKYAPESFKAYAVLKFSNGNKNVPEYTQIKLTDEETSICGNVFCTSGRNKALTELKKIIRNKIKESKQYCTIGFLNINNNKQFHYIRSQYCNITNLTEKLRIYKEFKKYILDCDCKIESFKVAKLDGNYKPESVTTEYDYIDIKKPVLVKFKDNKNYILA